MDKISKSIIQNRVKHTRSLSDEDRYDIINNLENQLEQLKIWNLLGFKSEKKFIKFELNLMKMQEVRLKTHLGKLLK